MMSTTTKDREIIVTRLIDAPRELVFAAFTEREHIEQGWAPKGATIHEMEVKPGGVWRYSQPGRNGAQYAAKITFIELDRPTRFVYDYGADGATDPVRTTVTFAEEDGKTKVTLQLLFVTAAERKQAVKYGGIVGAMQALENLANYLATV